MVAGTPSSPTRLRGVPPLPGDPHDAHLAAAAQREVLAVARRAAAASGDHQQAARFAAALAGFGRLTARHLC
jgi:hypothetical protein